MHQSNTFGFQVESKKMLQAYHMTQECYGTSPYSLSELKIRLGEMNQDWD